MCRWTSSRLPDTHPDTCQQQLNIVLRQPTQSGHHTPHRNREGDDRATHTAISPASNRYAANHIKYRKSKARQQPQLGIGETQFGFDWLLQYSQNLPINEIKSVGQCQQTQGIVAVAFAVIGAVYSPRGGSDLCSHFLFSFIIVSGGVN